MTGRQHSMINASVASVATLPVIYTGQFWILPAIFGIFYSILISPDSDVDAGFIGHKFVRQTFGHVGDWYWRNLWKPYAANFKHRGISHVPVVGTLTRMVYLLIPASIYLLPYDKESASFASVLFAQLLSLPLMMILVNLIVFSSYQVIIMFVLGAIIGDVLHIICDWI